MFTIYIYLSLNKPNKLQSNSLFGIAMAIEDDLQRQHETVTFGVYLLVLKNVCGI